MYLELFSLSCAAEYVDDFVLVELFHFITCRAEVFARVKFAWFVNKDLTYGCGHGKTAV